jgi:predicted metalloprotease
MNFVVALACIQLKMLPEEAINAAAAVGDDNIQNATQGYTRPETYTHGTSEQRMKWFTKGFKTGDIGAGDTFGELL